MSNRRLSVIMKRQRRSLLTDNLMAIGMAIGAVIATAAALQLFN